MNLAGVCAVRDLPKKLNQGDAAQLMEQLAVRFTTTERN
jgi:hypothetical protein